MYDKLGKLEFKLGGTMIVIKPKGYLYSLQGQSDCFIGLQGIDDSFRQFRLGTIFLRNFYTGLDFDQNLIILGVNAQTAGDSEVSIYGKAKNPYTKRETNPAGAIMAFLVLAMMFAAAIGFAIYHHKKMKNGGGTTYKIRRYSEDEAEELDSENHAKKKENHTIQDETLDESRISQQSNHYLSVTEALEEEKDKQ